MSIIFSFSLFFSSYLPLWISILFLDLRKIFNGGSNLWTETICVCMIFVFFILSAIVLLKHFSCPEITREAKYKLLDCKEEKTITSEYLLSYILPMFAFDFTCWFDVVSFLIFFICFGFLCIHHNQFSVNILLELFGYKFYSCELVVENISIRKTVISKKELSSLVGSDIRVCRINNEYVTYISRDNFPYSE